MTITQSQKKIKHIPSLRFPEFSGEWKEEVFKKCFKRIQEKNREINQNVLTISAQRGLVKQETFFTKLVSSKDVSGYYLLNKGDFAYNKSYSNGYPFGAIKRLTSYDKGIVSPLYICFKTTENDVSGDYFEKYFDSGKINREINRIAQEGARNHGLLNMSVREFFEDIKIVKPVLQEQKKIASFLSSVYEWVDNLQTQKENLEEYKKGMMQKIFSQEIRFKDDDGKNFPKWEEKKLEEILKERKEYSTKGKGYPHISLTTQGVVPKSERYNRDFLVGDDEVKGYKITRLNDLCYNPANLKFGVISINKLGAGIFSPIYVTFEIIGQNIDFVGYYLIRDEFINKARRYEQGTVYERMAVSPADFVKVKVAFPSLPEQQKIAYFLNSLDKAIEAKQQQITLAENWKKGLMQGLFI